jgi:hypothetical protein
MYTQCKYLSVFLYISAEFTHVILSYVSVQRIEVEEVFNLFSRENQEDDK